MNDSSLFNLDLDQHSFLGNFRSLWVGLSTRVVWNDNISDEMHKRVKHQIHTVPRWVVWPTHMHTQDLASNIRSRGPWPTESGCGLSGWGFVLRARSDWSIWANQPNGQFELHWNERTCTNWIVLSCLIGLWRITECNQLFSSAWSGSVIVKKNTCVFFRYMWLYWFSEPLKHAVFWRVDSFLNLWQWDVPTFCTCNNGMKIINLLTMGLTNV